MFLGDWSADVAAADAAVQKLNEKAARVHEQLGDDEQLDLEECVRPAPAMNVAFGTRWYQSKTPVPQTPQNFMWF